MEYNTKHKIGDKVRVREWEDMAQEFGLDEDGDIKTDKASFVIPMKEYCGDIITISNFASCGYYTTDKCGKRTRWTWTDLMFEEDKPIKKLNLEPIVTEFEIIDMNLQTLDKFQEKLFLTPQKPIKATMTTSPKVDLLEIAEKVNEVIDKINKI